MKKQDNRIRQNGNVKQTRHILYSMLVLMLLMVLTGSAAVMVIGSDLTGMRSTWIMNLAIDIFGMLVAMIILFSCVVELSMDTATRAFMRLLTLICINLFLDLCAWCFDGRTEHAITVKIINTLYFVDGYWCSLSFWIYIRAELKLKEDRLCNLMNWCAMGIGMVMVTVNWFTGFLFTVSPEGVYKRTVYNPLCLLPGVFILLMVAWKIFRQKMSYSDKLILLSYEIFPFTAMIFQIFYYGLSIMYSSALLGLLLVYANIYQQRSRKITEQQAILQQQNVAIMVSQIQPHFLYNTLTTISNLCRKDPEKAEEATVMFSQYLRGNLDSLKKTELVPVTAELEHVRIYLTLEQMRFGDKLNVEWDLKDSRFKIPALSIQPIVENSVKHGICEKEEPGTVVIRTMEENGIHKVIIEDDGVGFDTSAPIRDDGRSHVGMQNVIDRLEKMCYATVTVTSAPGQGCRTEIQIPER